MDISLLKEKDRKAFLQIGKLSREGVKKLLQEFGKACGEVEYIEDYEWLQNAITKWESYFKSEFGEHYLTPIEQPKKKLKRHLVMFGG